MYYIQFLSVLVNLIAGLRSISMNLHKIPREEYISKQQEKSVFFFLLQLLFQVCMCVSPQSPNNVPKMYFFP